MAWVRDVCTGGKLSAPSRATPATFRRLAKDTRGQRHGVEATDGFWLLRVTASTNTTYQPGRWRETKGILRRRLQRSNASGIGYAAKGRLLNAARSGFEPVPPRDVQI
ncbi:hypothetical protein GGTG_09624 [Gaeumannomyces tritici R3-111a-1]|uniref:Uncharacterized protein n=1 Tax=Gaeumannomyces tritici (strain R3-111a-1) TaxID=644352 RepID=J3P7Y5_GAET3|nr:hypothetical protein GGTG_09624 [Gaeumannomyces tritici R3-111a-1]EJT72768.1 hypothetical protein GGTG_09624 [Gaeumannomyces tritici R3-111a-1]